MQVLSTTRRLPDTSTDQLERRAVASDLIGMHGAWSEINAKVAEARSPVEVRALLPERSRTEANPIVPADCQSYGRIQAGWTENGKVRVWYRRDIYAKRISARSWCS